MTFKNAHAALALLLLCGGVPAQAHGFAGPRFFPATLTIDDPFVSDELSLPTIETSRDGDLSRETEYSIDVAKRLTENFGIGLEESWVHVSSPSDGKASGFANLGLSAKYLAVKDADHEFLLSFGIDAEIGGTGARRVDADRFSTISPAVFLGKGFGDLPSEMELLRPFALTAAIGIDIPTSASSRDDLGNIEHHPDILTIGFALEYNLQYLQTQVRDIGLSAPFDHMIPLVEFSFASPLDRDGGRTTGTINPGLIWAGQYFQLGAEGVIPVNGDSGHSVGAVVQLHFFLDDIFPDGIGRPVFDQ